jgi:large conductance mechanosensitive channel
MFKFFKEFKEFAVRGNVLDLAVGVIIGSAFGKIVTSLVEDIIMPPIGKLIGNVNFNDLFIPLNGKSHLYYESLSKARADASAAPIAYGQFINVLLNFIIVAFCIFLVVKGANAIRRTRSESDVSPTPAEKECPYCLSGVPIKATRCKYCTSQLETAAADKAGG